METKQTEIKQPEANKPQAKKPGKNPLNSTRFKRGGMATLLTVVFIAIVVVLNIVVSALTERFPSMDIDLTAQGLNTLSDQAVEIAKSVDQDTTIYLIGSEDAYEKNQIYSSYGLEYSQVANLAKRLAEANSKIKVEYVDPDTNPTFISEYADDNLSTGKVMVKTEARHRVLTVDDMFAMEQDQTTGAVNSYSTVDSALAGALELVNLEEVPIFTIATGHSEMLSSDNMGSFLGMIEDQNFEVQEIDLLTEEIPEGTQVLMLPTPTTDYTAEEVDKLRAFLDDTSHGDPVTLLVSCYPTQGSLPNFAAFLEEWGVKVESGVVYESDTSRMVLANASGIIVNASDEYLSDKSYNRLVTYGSAPLTMVFDGNSSVATYELWTTADSAYVVTESTTQEDVENPNTESQVVASLSSKYVQVDGSSVARSVAVFGSSNVFTDTFMNSTFGDGNYITDLMLYLTNNDGSSVTVSTERVQTNTADVSATRSTIDMLGILFAAVIPVVILAAGLVIFLKRRHL